MTKDEIKNMTLEEIKDELRHDIQSGRFNIRSITDIKSETLKEIVDDDIAIELIKLKTAHIRNIPVQIITEDFVQKLESSGIRFSIQEQAYIDECIKINKKLANEDTIVNVKNETDIKNKELSDDIEKLEPFFPYYIINEIKKRNINTVGELIDAYDAGIITTLFPKHAKELIPSIKLLKCKYFDIDPEIDENSTEELYQTLSKIGITVKGSNALRRSYKMTDKDGNIISKRAYYDSPYDLRDKDYDRCPLSTSDFFELVRNNFADLNSDNEEDKYIHFHQLGPVMLEHILQHAKIVTDYHDRHKKDEKSNEENGVKDELIQLRTELERLTEERNRLDNEINNVLRQILEKTDEKSKGGKQK